MDRIDQKNVNHCDVVSRSEFIYIEQPNDDTGPMDVIQIEKQSIPALIDALKKFME